MAAGSPSSGAPEQPRPPASAAMPLLAGARLPLAFIGAGLLAWAVAMTWLLLDPSLLLLPHLHPTVVGLAHLWLPGFLLSICFGALYQLLPVLLGTPLRLSERAVWLHLLVHALGVALLVRCFATGRYAAAGIGGSLILGGVVLVTFATWRTFAHAQRRDAIAWCSPLAVTWLLATVSSGLLLAANRHAPFLPVPLLDLLRAHAHLGLAGFFLTLLQGVTFQLVPMFTLGELRRPRCVAGGLIATQVGLVTLVAGWVMGVAGAVASGGAVIVVGLALSAVALHGTLQTRRRRQLEPGLRAFVAGAAALAAVAIAAWLLRSLVADEAFRLRGSMAYGVALIGGALSAMILGMLCKIIPFLVWMRAYGPRVGREPVPPATTLASGALERAWLRLHGAGVVLLTAGILGAQPLATVAGGWLLAAGAGCYLSNVGRVARHLRRPHPVRAPLSPSPISAR